MELAPLVPQLGLMPLVPLAHWELVQPPAKPLAKMWLGRRLATGQVQVGRAVQVLGSEIPEVKLDSAEPAASWRHQCQVKCWSLDCLGQQYCRLDRLIWADWHQQVHQSSVPHLEPCL